MCHIVVKYVLHIFYFFNKTRAFTAFYFNHNVFFYIDAYKTRRFFVHYYSYCMRKLVIFRRKKEAKFLSVCPLVFCITVC